MLILDRRPAVRGSTAASTAMSQHEIDMPLIRLQKQIGSCAANATWRLSVRAVYDLVDLTRIGVECSMESKPKIYIAGNLLGYRALKAEADACSAIGIKAEYLRKSDLFERYGKHRSGATFSPASASADPAQLATGLLKASLKRKAQLISPVEITDLAGLRVGWLWRLLMVRSSPRTTRFSAPVMNTCTR